MPPTVGDINSVALGNVAGLDAILAVASSNANRSHLLSNDRRVLARDLLAEVPPRRVWINHSHYADEARVILRLDIAHRGVERRSRKYKPTRRHRSRIAYIWQSKRSRSFRYCVIRRHGRKSRSSRLAFSRTTTLLISEMKFLSTVASNVDTQNKISDTCFHTCARARADVIYNDKQWR